MTWTIRAATPDDAATVVTLVHMLDRDEGVTDSPMTADDFLRNGFGDEARFRVLLAVEHGAALGYTMFQRSYDTEHAARGLYLIDLYVVPEARRRGVGRALVAAVARACQADGGRYLFWNAYQKNDAGRAFYRSLGAREEPVVTLSLQPEAMARLAAET